jgi:hypothetical protein
VSTRSQFYVRKMKWIDALGAALGKDHFSAHVAIVIAKHMNKDTGETFVGRETIADFVSGNVRSVERSVQRLEKLGFLRVCRARGRGHANVYSMAFPETAACTPPIKSEKAYSTPPFDESRSDEKKAASAEPKGGAIDEKRRSVDRPNLKESNLKELTLENLNLKKDEVAAPPMQLRKSLSTTTPGFERMVPANTPRPFVNRGQYEGELADILSKLGINGWDAVMSLDEFKVAALCRRLRNRTLTQEELSEVVAVYRKKSSSVPTAA